MLALDNSGYYKTPAILYAYSTANLATQLYNSTQAANSRDAAAVAVKFTPHCRNGIYIGGRDAFSSTTASQWTAQPPLPLSLRSGAYSSTQTIPSRTARPAPPSTTPPTQHPSTDRRSTRSIQVANQRCFKPSPSPQASRKAPWDRQPTPSAPGPAAAPPALRA